MTVLPLVRYAVFGLVALSALFALAAMAVQRRTLNPFGRPARLIRDLTDPFLKPIERRVLRSGGNPQSAPWWLVGIALVIGILTVTAANWLVEEAAVVADAASGGGRSLAAVIASGVFTVIQLALMIRVLGSWIGAGQYNKWMRPFYFLTEWFLAPLRRILPPLGPLDLSPLVAWLTIAYLIRPLVMRLF